jgi:Flp pilus assembly protein TadG
MMRALVQNQRGGSVVEFALLAPTFLMFLFLLLDGGRMMFTKQSLNEVAAATARCAAIKATGCTDAATAQNWAVARGLARDNLQVSSAVVDVATCNGIANMSRATINTVWKKSAMGLLPQSLVPSTLTSVACFPIAA